MPFLRSVGTVLWGSQGQISLFRTKESGVFISSMGVSSKECARGRTGEGQGRLLIAGLLGKSYQKLTFVCESVGHYAGQALA